MYFPKQFRGIFDFGYQRRGLEVPTFYFTYLIGSIMLGAIVGVAISALLRSDTVRIQWNVDLITASILFLTISHFMIQKKALADNIKIIWLLPIITAALTLFTGHLLGLIIPTILATRPNKNIAGSTASQTVEKPKENPTPTSDPDQQAS
jgi:hypothetical protein